MPSEALAWMLIAICMLVEGLHNRNYRRHVPFSTWRSSQGQTHVITGLHLSMALCLYVNPQLYICDGIPGLPATPQSFC